MNYSIETMHGDEICAGISGLNEAKETAQRHANKRGECVFVTRSDGDSIEVAPDADD